MDFEKIFNQSEKDEDLIVMDDLGHLLKFMISCIVMTKENNQKLNCDINVYEKILAKLIEKATNARMEQLNIFNSVNAKNGVILSQFLNCCEALIVYLYTQIKYNDENIMKIMLLFEKHQEVQKKAKKLFDGNKKAQKSDKKATAKIEISTKSILNLKDCAVFLKAIFDANQNERMNEMKQNKDFCQFVLTTTSQKLTEFESVTEHSKMKYSRSFFEAYLTCSSLFYQQLNPDTFQTFYDNYSEFCAVSLVEAFKSAIHVMDRTYGGKKEKWMQLLKSMTGKDDHSNDAQFFDSMLLEVIQRIHANVEWMFEQEKKGVETVSTVSGTLLLKNLFVALETLYSKFTSLSSTKSRDCFNWILGFCKRTSVKQKPLATVIIKLFMASMHRHENALLIDCVAHKIAACYNYRRNLVEPECASQNNFAIITKQLTVDDAFGEFIELIKEQIYVIDFYIKRANSFNARASLKSKGLGREYFNDTCSTLESIERAICTKLISLGISIERVISCRFPVSLKNIELVVGIIKLYYGCLAKLMKHFRRHHDIKHINYQAIGIEELIKYSKKFATGAYDIAPYIESMADLECTKGKDKDKKSVKHRNMILNKETKIIPRMIFLIEYYNACVIQFDTAAKTPFSTLLHAGEVRDFHIKNSMLKNAIMRSQTTARSQTFIEDEEENDDDENTNDSAMNENSSDNENIQPKKKKNLKRKRLASDSSATTSDSEANRDEDDEDEESNASLDETPLTREKFENNLRIVTSTATGKRRSSRKKT